MKSQAEIKRYRGSWNYLSAQVKQRYPELNIFERVGLLQELLGKDIKNLNDATEEQIKQALTKSRENL